MQKEMEATQAKVNEKSGRYKTLREVLHIKKNKPISTKHLKERLREILAYEYGNILREAIQVINYNRPG